MLDRNINEIKRIHKIRESSKQKNFMSHLVKQDEIAKQIQMANDLQATYRKEKQDCKTQLSNASLNQTKSLQQLKNMHANIQRCYENGLAVAEKIKNLDQLFQKYQHESRVLRAEISHLKKNQEKMQILIDINKNDRLIVDQASEDHDNDDYINMKLSK